MARDKKTPPSGPNNGYLISFGDTMTALLAFFIVLNSLAKEQTGAKLYAGTGSFIRAMESMGLPGMFPKEGSSQPFQMEHTAPHYVVPDPENGPPDHNPLGPDDDGDTARVVDYEQESFHRFLLELRRLNTLEPLENVTGAVSFDVLGTLAHEQTTMPEEMRSMLNLLGPQLRRAQCELEITVWATTPSPSAWMRSIRQANELREAAGGALHLNQETLERVRAVGRTWISSDLQRPAVTLTLRTLSPPFSR